MASRTLPLPRVYSEPLRGKTRDSRNAGLVFDRGPDHWAADFAGAPVAAARHSFLDAVAAHAQQPPVPTLLRDLRGRRRALLAALGGRELDPLPRLTWRLASGLGAGHVLENGFIWDRNLGVPYVPGSSVKGLLREWVKRWEHQGARWSRYQALFGDTDQLGVGEVIVHDAFPVGQPKLECDVMSVHAQSYYADSSNLPVDHEPPSVIEFLTIAPGTPFSFALSPRSGASPDMDEAERLLRAALTTLGVGSKTAVGYGHFA